MKNIFTSRAMIKGHIAHNKFIINFFLNKLISLRSLLW